MNDEGLVALGALVVGLISFVFSAAVLNAVLDHVVVPLVLSLSHQAGVEGILTGRVPAWDLIPLGLGALVGTAMAVLVYRMGTAPAEIRIAQEGKLPGPLRDASNDPSVDSADVEASEASESTRGYAWDSEDSDGILAWNDDLVEEDADDR